MTVRVRRVSGFCCLISGIGRPTCANSNLLSQGTRGNSDLCLNVFVSTLNNLRRGRSSPNAAFLRLRPIQCLTPNPVRVCEASLHLGPRWIVPWVRPASTDAVRRTQVVTTFWSACRKRRTLWKCEMCAMATMFVVLSTHNLHERAQLISLLHHADEHIHLDHKM